MTGAQPGRVSPPALIVRVWSRDMAQPETGQSGWAETLAWWRGLPPLVRVAVPALTLANVAPILSLSEHVIALHGFIADAVGFY